MADGYPRPRYRLFCRMYPPWRLFSRPAWVVRLWTSSSPILARKRESVRLKPRMSTFCHRRG